MLEDFLIKSARSRSETGYLRLAREGYELTLSPDRATLTAYSTVHRERTWDQVKRGVPSRFGKRLRPESGPRPEPGPPVPFDQFTAVFDPDTVHLTSRVLGSFARLAALRAASNDELEQALRAAVRQLETGTVTCRENDLLEVEVDHLRWLITPDCRLVVGVRRAPSDSTVPDTAETIPPGTAHNRIVPAPSRPTAALVPPTLGSGSQNLIGWVRPRRWRG